MNRIMTGKEKYRIPHSVQDLIPVRRIWEDGIFLSTQGYSRTWKYSDINYAAASEEQKEELFMKYRNLLNVLDTGAVTKITIRNRRQDTEELKRSFLYSFRNDGLDMYRREYNDMILSTASDPAGKVQDRYITVTVNRKSIEEAKTYFARAEQELGAAFSVMGSVLTSVGTEEKLRILHGIYRGEDIFPFSIRDAAAYGEDFRNMIAADSAEITPDHIKLGDRYFRTFFLKYYANAIADDFLMALTDISPCMTVTADIIPVPTETAIKEAESRLLGIETNITGWQRRQNRNGNFSAGVPYDLQLQREETRQFLEDLTSRDQRMMQTVITVMVSACSMRELDDISGAVISFGRSRMCQFAPLRFRQREGLDTVLPIGVCSTDAFRTLVTDSLAVFMPFRVQEIMDRGGIYIGRNAVSGNLLICSRERLLNQSAFLLGVPGSGKSFCAKMMVMSLLLNTEDDILICDPEGEYLPIAEAAGREAGVISISARGGCRLNPMYTGTGKPDREALAMKSELILSLISRIENRTLGPRHRSVVDRCIRKVYSGCRKMGEIPTMRHLTEELLAQKEPEAAEIALSLELYTTGSLDIFSGEEAEEPERRLTVFDISGMEENLKDAGLLIITDAMLSRVNSNSRKGRRTHLFIDEFHVVFSNEHSAEFFSSAWRQFRKRNAFPTAITQNVESVLDSVHARTMLSNSEFIVMFSQASSDRDKLASLLNISDEQLRYISGAEPGSGLIRYGGALVPFLNRFPTDTSLYRLMTTTPGERISR